MRDPEDARKFFVGGNEIDKFRDCLISEQVNFLTNAYNEMIKSEYAELRAPDTDAMRQKLPKLFSKARPRPKGTGLYSARMVSGPVYPFHSGTGYDSV